MPSQNSTNAAAANAFLAQSGDKTNQLNSNQTFNGGPMFGSKLNTKTNAQLTASKGPSATGGGAGIITPKVSNADPEIHRK